MSSFAAHMAVAAPSGATNADTNTSGRGAGKSEINFSNWSEKRITAYKKTSAMLFGPPIGILTIPRLRMEVPILNGTDAVTPDRAVGRIIGTAKPEDATGNVAIAGHRDGFFRDLKDIALGDVIIVSSSAGRKSYSVDRIKIVTPDDVSVLEARMTPSMTLVTCYPFYFIGDAPQRYIVQATLNRGEPKQQLAAN